MSVPRIGALKKFALLVLAGCCWSFAGESVPQTNEDTFIDPAPRAGKTDTDPINVSEGGEFVAPQPNKNDNPTPVAAPEAQPSGESAKADDKKADDKNAEPKPVEADTKPKAADGGKKAGAEPDGPELDETYEPIYQRKEIEGYAGWRRNKVSHSAINQDVLPIPDRWRTGLANNPVHVHGSFWNPYRQNMLKGDYPIIGQSIFLSVLGVSDSLLEGHRVPTPANVSTQRPGEFQFFGRGDQFIYNQNFIVSLEFFKGETDFKPREWEIRLTPVFNVNYTHVEENFVTNIDPRKENDRVDYQLAFQELFGEYHLRDISPYYDFVSTRTGIQFFQPDFRGFLFSDNNLGARVFGTMESNRLQYNLAYFEMLNKDTNSGLNTTFEFKDEHVLLANLIRQDTFTKGYNMVFNLGFSDEESSKEYNQNGVIVRPAPIGSLRPHSVKAGYVGFGGDGHIGRLNITHQFYQAFGTDSENPLAGRRQTINGQMFALELSYDKDWMRFRTSYFYSSGDKDVYDSTANGFDAIFDNPNFAGGQFSYWVRQGFGAGNALTLLKDRFSLIPNLATSKGEGQANFVNPGIHLFNVGYDADLTPRLKVVTNVNYLRFAETNPLEVLFQQNGIHNDLGVDYSMGVVYRPLLNNQVIITGGLAGFSPLRGFKDIYTSTTLYSGFLGLTVKY